MKKYLLYLTAAAMIFCSCEKDEPEKQQSTYTPPSSGTTTTEETKVDFIAKVVPPLTVVIKDKSTGIHTNLIYDMGDGTQITKSKAGEMFEHRYKKAGQYRIYARTGDKQHEAGKDVTINEPAIYAAGLTFKKVDKDGMYYRFSLDDDGPILVKTWFKSTYTPILYNSSLPYTFTFTNSVLLENPSKHDYYTLYVHYNTKQSGDGTQCLKQQIKINKFLEYPEYIEVKNNSGNTQVRLNLGYK